MATPTGRLRRSDRLLRTKDFQRVARQGTRVACREFVLLVAPAHEPGSAALGQPAGQGSRRRSWQDKRTGRVGPAGESVRRLGVTASRKVGNAVVRNRLKRRIREWFRMHRDRWESCVDIVVIARPGAGSLESHEIQARLGALTQRAGLGPGA